MDLLGWGAASPTSILGDRDVRITFLLYRANHRIEITFYYNSLVIRCGVDRSQEPPEGVGRQDVPVSHAPALHALPGLGRGGQPNAPWQGAGREVLEGDPR